MLDIFKHKNNKRIIFNLRSRKYRYLCSKSKTLSVKKDNTQAKCRYPKNLLKYNDKVFVLCDSPPLPSILLAIQ